MARLPYYPMYPSDYLKDTVHLSLDEHGFYILMLQNLWEYDGELPADPKQLSRILRIDPRQARRYLQGKLGDMFEISNGLVRNKRLSKELTQATEKHKKLSDAGKKGNEKRWSPGDTPPQSHTDTDTDTDITPLTPLPEGVNSTAWQEFEQHRKDIRKPLTDLARKKNLTVLQNLSAEEQQQAVDQTIANRWTGLFPPKGKANAAPKQDTSAVGRVRAAHRKAAKREHDGIVLDADDGNLRP